MDVHCSTWTDIFRYHFDGAVAGYFFYYITGGLKGECCPEGYLGITVLQAHPVGVTRVGK